MINEIQKKQVMLGDDLTTQWVITNPDGFVVWATFDKKIAQRKQYIIDENKLQETPTKSKD